MWDISSIKFPDIDQNNQQKTLIISLWDSILNLTKKKYNNNLVQNQKKKRRISTQTLVVKVESCSS